MNKTSIAVVVIVVVLVGGYFLLRGAYQPTAPVTRPSNRQIVTQPPSQQPSSQSSTEQASVTKENVVIYSDTSYLPATLQIKKGEVVTFKNQSSRSMWTASGKHPTHILYPTTGGCIGSTFDACQGVQPGASWLFKFDTAGTWKYHNHLNPGDTGTIMVE